MTRNAVLVKTRKFFEKSYISFLVRLFVSGVLLFFLLRLIVTGDITEVFRRIHPAYLAIYYLLYMIGLGAQVWRWKYLLEAWDIHQTFGILLRWTLTGMFVNNFLPGGLGGDAFRLYIGARSAGNLEDVAATIFYERMLSYASLVSLGVCALVIRANYSEDRLFWVLLSSIFFILAGLFAFLSLPAFGKFTENCAGRYKILQKIKIMNWLESFHFKIHHPSMLLGIFLISITIQSIEVVLYYAVASAVHLRVQLSDLFLFVPLLYLAVSLPLSVNGIGIRETVFLFFASRWGISQPEAVAFSLTIFSLNLVASLVGGPLYWMERAKSALSKVY